MTQTERAALVSRYKEGYRQAQDVLKDASEEELDFRRKPDKWTSREIVHHLADSETTSGIRLRRLLVETRPFIQGYDQEEFARKLHYAKRPIEHALKAFEAARETTAQLLDLMTEEDWKRTGEHTESGPYTPETWLGIYAAHAHNHASQIRENRTACRAFNSDDHLNL